MDRWADEHLLVSTVPKNTPEVDLSLLSPAGQLLLAKYPKERFIPFEIASAIVQKPLSWFSKNIIELHVREKPDYNKHKGKHRQEVELFHLCSLVQQSERNEPRDDESSPSLEAEKRRRQLELSQRSLD